MPRDRMLIVINGEMMRFLQIERGPDIIYLVPGIGYGSYIERVQQDSWRDATIPGNLLRFSERCYH